MTNQAIADVFERYAVLLELEGANPFRIRAYLAAAHTLATLPHSLTDWVREDKNMSAIEGIGKELAEKIKQIVTTGKLRQLEELEGRIPPVLLEMLKIPGLGPKRIRALNSHLKLDSLDDLKQAALQGNIAGLKGFGKKTEEQILKGIEFRSAASGRMLWADARTTVNDLIAYLKKSPAVQTLAVAGSFRRRKETVGDIDILCTSKTGAPVMDHFVKYPGCREIRSQGDTRSTIILTNDLQIDLRVVPAESFGAAMHYFTGSQAHNIAVRRMAQKHQLKVNEYGIYRGTRRLGGRTEQDVFTAIGLPYLEPELRENRGEFHLTRGAKPPKLIERKQIRGDLHCHTDETDGRLSLEELAKAAQALGYEYIAVTDHSRHVAVANGMDEKRLARQIKRIDKLNARFKNFTLLKGIEVDILDQGKLDLPDSILRDLDFTVGSIHYKFNLTEEQQTSRILKAMDNPYFTILGHPTGRLLGYRPGYAVNMEQVIRGAKERACFIELNSHPERLDITDVYCQVARQAGVHIAVSSDAHSREGLESIEYGINQARRGWLEAGDVLNAQPLKKVRSLLGRRR